VSSRQFDCVSDRCHSSLQTGHSKCWITCEIWALINCSVALGKISPGLLGRNRPDRLHDSAHDSCGSRKTSELEQDRERVAASRPRSSWLLPTGSRQRFWCICGHNVILPGSDRKTSAPGPPEISENAAFAKVLSIALCWRQLATPSKIPRCTRTSHFLANLPGKPKRCKCDEFSHGNSCHRLTLPFRGIGHL